MKRAIFCAVLGSILFASYAAAQSKPLKDELVGSWTPTSVVNTSTDGTKTTPFGEHPLGVYIFDASGRFSEIIDNPEKETNVNYFGTYSVNDDGKSFILHIVGSSATRFNGTDVKRDVISISEDGMQLHNPTASLGGSAISTWKRVK